MSLFRHKRHDNSADNVEDESYEEAEQNPELLAAEEAVNRLPYSAPLVNPIDE
jgi:hypothetical protein